MRDSASPQVEDGYTRLANELLEALLRARLTARQWAVVMAIARKTYGFNKKEDDIGLSQLAELTGLAKPHVSVAVRELEQRQIICKKPGVYAHSLAINKDYAIWDAGMAAQEVKPLVTDSVTVTESVTKGYQIGNLGVTESVTTKDKPKEMQKKAPREEITFKKWIEQCKEQDIAPIPADDGVFDYANSVGLTTDHVRLAWLEFKRKYGTSRKRYKLWTQHFQNAVRENWYGIWFDKAGAWELTTRGKQLQIELEGKRTNA